MGVILKRQRSILIRSCQVIHILQTAQPVLFSHWIMSYFQMLKRDYERFSDCMRRLNYCPLGSGALAGTTFDIDRFYTANKLGFTAPTEIVLMLLVIEILSLNFCQMRQSVRCICQDGRKSSLSILLQNSNLLNYLMISAQEAASCPRRKTLIWLN